MQSLFQIAREGLEKEGTLNMIDSASTTTTADAVKFSTLQSAVAKQFKTMSARPLYSTTADHAGLWETYLASFPPGSNLIYKTRTEYDCSCCRHFIKTLGGVVNVVDGALVTLWDFEVGGAHQSVVDAMAAFVRAHAVENLFLHPEKLVGTISNRQLLEDKSVKTWEHFHVNLPTEAVVAGAGIGPILSDARATHDVLARGLAEITPDAIAAVLELIAQGSLYRGEEHAGLVNEFRKLKLAFTALPPAADKDLYVWERVSRGASSAVAKIRNTVIGTLLTDLSEGKDLEDAVKAFEKKVAPENYKRPTALVTKAMVAAAQKTVDELGLTTALERRYATMDDITVPNTLFADRSARRAMGGRNVFDEVAATAAVDVKKLGKVEEVPVADFLARIVPLAETIEVLLENRHAGNLVSLIAPVDPTANRLFKWPNGFSWAYSGDLADSIKEKVKSAGGNVTGDFRASLAWSNHDDLDLHLRGPRGIWIYFRDKVNTLTRGALDVDMNAGGGQTRTPVENIVFPERQRMPEGGYVLAVNNFHQRETKDVGFEVEMEFGGEVHSFSYPKIVKHQETVQVCTFLYSHAEGLKITESLPFRQATKTIWNLPTQTFHKVRMVMHSPNHWDGREVGNKHLFFMLEGCQNDGVARGFFNEFLSDSLTPHRKVLEMVGARMKTEKSEAQLSGVGFSSTRRDYLLCRVAGAFTRTVKVLL